MSSNNSLQPTLKEFTMKHNRVKPDKVAQKDFLLGLIWGQISRLGDIGLSFLFSILIVRLIGKTEYGIYSTVLNLVGFLVVLTGLGFSETLTHYLPEAWVAVRAYHYSLLRQFLNIRLIGSIIAGGMVWLISPWLAVWVQSPSLANLGWLLLLLAISFNLSELLTNYYIACFQLKLIFMIRSLTQLAGVIITLFWFTLMRAEAIICLLVLLITTSVQILIYLRNLPLFHLFNVIPVPRDRLINLYRYARDVWFINLSTYALAGQFDILALAFLLKDSSQVAYYALASLILARLQSLVTGWSSSTISVFSTIYTQEGQAGLSRYFNYYWKLNLLTVLPTMASILGISATLVPLLFGNDFSPAVPLIWVYTLHISISIILGSGVVYYLLLTMNRHHYLLRWRIFLSLANIILDILLIPGFGALGAVIATGVANSSLHFIELWLVRDVVQKLPWLFFFKLLGGLTLALAMTIVTTRLIYSNFWATTVGLVIFVVILLGVLLVLKPFDASDLALTSRWLPRLTAKLRYFTKGGQV